MNSASPIAPRRTPANRSNAEAAAADKLAVFGVKSAAKPKPDVAKPAAAAKPKPATTAKPNKKPVKKTTKPVFDFGADEDADKKP